MRPLEGSDPEYLTVNEEEFRRAHRDRTLIVLFTGGVGLVCTALVVSFSSDVVAGKLAFVGLLPAIGLMFVAWAIVAGATIALKRHARFYADPTVFIPYLLPVRWVLSGRTSAKYEDVVEAEAHHGLDAGLWFVTMKMKTGEELWVPRVREIPDAAYSYLLMQLSRHNIPIKRVREPTTADVHPA
jgi:hypothetical protein